MEKWICQMNFRRGVEQRHVMMLSFGGVIVTGLFLSIGYTLQQVGPKTKKSQKIKSFCDF
ncbi:hypothetical protein ACMGE7_01855 [Macrococcus equi]|uniref:hypothetical protein n=1 Tax=Macrococcus equi TaxID=3395462 RepID=UPI0039BE164E